MNLIIEDQFGNSVYKIDSFYRKGNCIYGKCNKEEVLLGKYFNSKQATEEYNKIKNHMISDNKEIYKMSNKTYNKNGLHFEIKKYNIEECLYFTDIILYNEDNEMIIGKTIDCEADEQLIERFKSILLHEENLVEEYSKQQLDKLN